jgi:uncharacterized glyoxalase superfamily protein PhnB
MALEKLPADARLVVVALEVTECEELDEVGVTLAGLDHERAVRVAPSSARGVVGDKSDPNLTQTRDEAPRGASLFTETACLSHGRNLAVRKPAAHHGSATDPDLRHGRNCNDSAVPLLDVIGLIVADLARSAAFYERLGLSFPEDLDPEGHGHVETTIRGGVRFTLDTEESIRSFDPDWATPTDGHRTTIAFLCGSPEDVDRVYAQLVEAGAPSYKPPWDAFWGQRYAQVKDPDGNVVDLFAPISGAA